jgi:alpha-tubulin suppressor-like RCC1 family protein
VTDLAAGNEHTCARRSDGAVYCWGAANFGQAGDGHLQDHRYATAVPGAADAASVALGPYRSCACMANGTLQCWGRNDAGQLADGTNVSRSTPLPIRSIPSGVADVVVGAFHTCARMTDETARCWGSGASGRLGDGTGATQASPVAVQNLTSALELSAYDGHTCARTRDGAVRCWGQNTYGQIGDGTTTDRTAPVVITLR